MSRSCFFMFLGCFVAWAVSKSLSSPRINKGLQIIGGRNTTIAKHPYQVSISFKDNYYCSGAVVGKSWVLTTASCIYQVQNDTEYMKVRVKSTYHASEGATYNVTRCNVHPQFLFFTMDYNLAILKVDKAFVFSKTLKKISLAKKALKVKQKAVVSGWGTSNKLEPPQDSSLKEIDTFVVSQDTCQKSYSEPTLSNRMFCTKSKDYGPCWDDDADLAVVKNNLYGLLSFNNGCDFEEPSPSVYSNVAVMRKWILTAIKN